jgi:flagellar FliJ protein
MTSKKRFELHQVLNYRTDVEKLRKQDFAAARQDLDFAVDQLQKEAEELETLSQTFQEKQGAINSIDELRMYSDFFKRKKEELKEQQEKVVILDRILEDRRGELVLATQDKKALESLKEKKELAFQQQQNLKDREFMDEMSVQKKGRE